MKCLVGLALGAALAVPLPAAAEQATLQKIADGGSITLGYRRDSIPFSYSNGSRRPVGYSIDLCRRVVEAVKKSLAMPKLEVRYRLVTSTDRIPLTANGTLDLECGTTVNNPEREKQVGFAVTTFVSTTRLLAKKASHVESLADLKGKTVVSTAGTPNIKLITRLNAERNLGMNILSANGHKEAFGMVQSGRALAFAMDDVLLAALVANSEQPDEFSISPEALSVEPTAIMLRRDDPAFKKLADDTLIGLMKSGEIRKIYAKWFQSPIPPRGINMNLPMSPELKKAIAHPTDSGDPADYR